MTSPVSDERLAARIANIEADLAKNISAKARKIREEGLLLLRELQARRKAYHPQLIHYAGEGDPYWEIINDDTPSVNDTPVASNVEFIRDMKNRDKVIGLRVYDPDLSRRSLDTAGGVARKHSDNCGCGYCT